MNHYNTTYVATRDDLNQNIVASCNNVANMPVGSKLKNITKEIFSLYHYPAIT